MTRSAGFAALAVLALQLVLVVLRLTHVLRWSWWWVTAPAWLCALLVGLLLLAMVLPWMLDTSRNN
jgi:hypothetical protein